MTLNAQESKPSIEIGVRLHLLETASNASPCLSNITHRDWVFGGTSFAGRGASCTPGFVDGLFGARWWEYESEEMPRVQLLVQANQCDFFVATLTSLILTGHYDPRWAVANPHRRLPSVDVLATRPTGTKGFDVTFSEKRPVGLRQAIVVQGCPLRHVPISSLCPLH